MWKIQASSKFASSGNMIRDRTAYLHALQTICCALCRKESETYLYFFWGGGRQQKAFLNNIFYYGTQLVHSFSLIKQIVLQRNHKSDLGAHHNSPRRLLSKHALVHSVIVMPEKTNVAARKATVPNKSKNSVDINTSRKEMELIKAPVTFF